MSQYGFDKVRNESAHRTKIIIVLIAFLCVCLAFLAGFFVRGDETLLRNLGFESLVTSVDENPGTTVSGNTYNSLSARVAEVEGILQNESLDSYDLEVTTAVVLGAFSDSTSDNYLRYYTPERYNAYVQESSGKYAGIGVLFSELDGRAYVVDVFPGSEAESAGVERGDYILAIDGDRSQDWSLTETINALSRDEGESVVVTWERLGKQDSDTKEFSTTLTTAKYTEPNIISELHDSVGYIKVQQITQNSSELTKKAIQDLSARGARSFVLDLRDNPGGYLTQAVELASLFVKSGVIVGIETKEDHNTTKSATGMTATDLPLVVLVNGNTSAAAEVLGSALKDNNRAIVVGQTSMGKGSVQVVKPLSFGGAVRYTAAFYKSPLGYDINNIGVIPDVVVDLHSAEDDNQKKLALETAQALGET